MTGADGWLKVWYDCVFELSSEEKYESPGLYFGDDVGASSFELPKLR